MKFSEHWLREWVNPALDTQALCHLLTMAGLEVEDTEPAAPPFSGVVVAEVKSIVKHPNADRLRVCQVDAGTGELVQIVCGAPNVAEGVRIPCALPGAELPGDFRIKPTKMRGEVSNGMLCSGKELGIPDDVDGLLLLPADAPVGQSIRDYLALDDQSIELKITPNRADCLSLRGVAREVAALTGATLNEPAIAAVEPVIDERRQVTLSAPAACPRYIGRVIRNVNARAATPDWMRRKLERAGLRSISAVVDVTNYVLLEQGQPLHAFDLARLNGDINVRMALPGEQLTLLNGKDVTLDADMLVIADAGKAVALAGIMGGANSEVSDDTTDVFLESAFFAPEAIAGRARRLGLTSDASYRYERGVDYALQQDAIERATALILSVCGGEAGPLTEAVADLPVKPAVVVRVARVNRVLGLALPADDMALILERLGFEFSVVAGGFAVIPPSFRFDIEIEEDLIEEIARVHGYEAIPADRPHGGLAMLPQPEESSPRELLRRALVGRDYQEIVSYAFVDARWETDFASNADPVRLINPIASQMSVMRSTLIGGLVDTLVGNLNRKQPRVRVFEIARVFRKEADGSVVQPERLAGLAYGSRLPEQWGCKTERTDFFDVKADVEALLFPRRAEFRRAVHPALHPGRTAEVVLDGRVVGVVGELHPNWVHQYDLPAAPVLFELDLAVLLGRSRIEAQPVSRFQPVRRDVALVAAEGVEAGAVRQSLLGAAPAFVREVQLFDVYRGKGVDEGKKSLAFKVLMQDTSRTLTDEEVEAAISGMIDAAAGQHGVVLRV
ncbi:MAG: phenylalanine--tRNA ligase subunit beta [Laribacter sp.]|nr:phenylalanine--tRNA ligase subunit beta [Laribacter sp.]MBP9609180.1 phenylalanine--tRNA ligase subunit beta [Laribacter sp.]